MASPSFADFSAEMSSSCYSRSYSPCQLYRAATRHRIQARRLFVCDYSLIHPGLATHSRHQISDCTSGPFSSTVSEETDDDVTLCHQVSFDDTCRPAEAPEASPLQPSRTLTPGGQLQKTIASTIRSTFSLAASPSPASFCSTLGERPPCVGQESTPPAPSPAHADTSDASTFNVLASAPVTATPHRRGHCHALRSRLRTVGRRLRLGQHRPDPALCTLAIL